MSQDKITVEFMPGCFDDWTGTQEELDEFVREIRRMAETGELEAISEPLGDDAWDLLPEETKHELLRDSDDDSTPRTRH